ncbi:MAG TPA: hypothetical protein VK973_12205, partial [Arenicellales bacterium]|nr:hypothetical protein [Arenicellales bacterium]
YRGVEVATRRPDWAAGVPAQYLRKVQRLDYALGVIHIDDLAELPITVRSHRFAFSRRAAIADWRGWLHAREGRANGFWQPQWQMDLTQTGAIAADGLELRVRAVDYSTRYAADPGRQDLALLHRSGRWYFRRVVSASTLGEDELLELDAALGIDAAPGDFTLITWLVPARLDADEVELTWHTAGVVTSTVDIRSLRTP